MKWLKNLFGSKEPAKNAVVSTATLQREPGDVYVIRISGLFSKGTMDKIQAIGAQAFEKGAKDIKVLFVTRDFKGWQRGDNLISSPNTGTRSPGSPSWETRAGKRRCCCSLPRASERAKSAISSRATKPRRAPGWADRHGGVRVKS
jgi:hypothetical protein